MKFKRNCLFFIFSILTTFSILSSVAFSQTSQPILRIETGMHTAILRRISVDYAGRFLVTASEDKTARVWDIATGELLRVLRPPLGAGNEGNLYAVAISPDGNAVAVAGWTSPDGLNKNIYLFDRANGRLTRRLSGLPNVVNHLVFAPDGKHLMAALGGGNGIRIYDTDGWQQIGADTDYGGDSYGADFDRHGRLVTSCRDGFVRLYAFDANGLRLLAKQTVPGGKEPYSVKFSPDGSKIAVGFGDSKAVNVLSAADLRLRFVPDTNGVEDAGFLGLAWSATGDMLYAGGKDQREGGNFLIRLWRDGGRGSFRETIASQSTILDLQPLPDGSVIYSAGSPPAWGVIDSSGNRPRFVISGIADFRNDEGNFRVSNDGTEIGFGYEFFGKSAAQFSLVKRRLELTKNQNLKLPSLSADNINITDWKNTYEPKLNGNKLRLKEYETSRSLAITPDNKQFLLGTEFWIRMFDQTGKELWNVPASAAWAVNISGDGRLAVAAFGDGTIRWYRVSDGAELLAFFPHNDKKRWVLWTPSGYYDASPDAEELIGWHVNNGKDAAADFFPVSRFRDVYYRPDIIDRVLKDLDETVAVNKANEAANRRQQDVDIAKRLPPVVTILSPQEGSEVSVNKVKIRYEVRTPSGEAVTGYKVLIDGRPATIERGVGVKVVGANVGELTVTIPEKDCEISLIAENKYAASVASSVGLKWKGKISAAVAKKPRLLVLAVGVSKYQMADLNLGYAAKDANDFVAAMSRQKPAMYGEVIVKLLTDEQATRNAVVDGLDWINANTNAEDVAMVFFAGHGDNDNLNRYYFLPHNFNPQSASTKVTFNDIKSVVETIKGKALFFIDTCRSGNVLGKSLGRNLTGFANELSAAENGVIVFTASTGTQVSLEDAAWGNGAFTKALVEGINGRADLFQKGNITITALDAYISNRVKELTEQKQTPATAKPDLVSDFPIAAKF